MSRGELHDDRAAQTIDVSPPLAYGPARPPASGLDDLSARPGARQATKLRVYQSRQSRDRRGCSDRTDTERGPGMIERVRQCPKHDLAYSGKECPECGKLRARAWRERHPERAKEINRKQYQKQREWKHNHPEQTKEHNHRYYKKQGGVQQREYEARNRSAQSERTRKTISGQHMPAVISRRTIE